MTDMKRVTVAFPDDIDMAILGLKKTEMFHKCSYSEIVRRLVKHGLTLSEVGDFDQLQAEPTPPPEAGIRDSA